jgi:hypothetical protein
MSAPDQVNGVSSIKRALKSAPRKEVVIVQGGEEQAEGDPCAGLHNHGFRGVEERVVETIADWIVNALAK